MENPMTARFYLFTDELLLDDNMIPTLAAVAMKKGNSDPVSLTKRPLVLDKKDNSLTVPIDEFLVLVGTTAELKDFRRRLNAANVDAIGFKQSRRSSGSPLVTWCTRANVKHPEKKIEPGGTDVTVLLICRDDLLTGSPFPQDPWHPFDHSLSGLLELDDDFDRKLDAARKLAKAN
jgi:hypothetical protein